jgi:hypothetical protein
MTHVPEQSRKLMSHPGALTFWFKISESCPNVFVGSGFKIELGALDVRVVVPLSF